MNGMVAAWLKGHDVEVHVVTHIIGIDETGCRPAAIRSRHGRERALIFMRENRWRKFQSFNLLEDLANPVKLHSLGAGIVQFPR